MSPAPTTDPDGRTATAPTTDADTPVTLINKFVVPPEQDDEFFALWEIASRYFRQQPGFIQLRFHKAVTPDAEFRYVNVASWTSLQAFRDAHASEAWKAIVTGPEWQRFPSTPVLYTVVATADADR